jgi:hypothetical protein
VNVYKLSDILSTTRFNVVQRNDISGRACKAAPRDERRCNVVKILALFCYFLWETIHFSVGFAQLVNIILYHFIIFNI